MDRQKKSLSHKGNPNRSTGRLLWLFAAALFLLLAVFALAVAVRTRADGRHFQGHEEHYLGEGEPATLPADPLPGGIPAARLAEYPSPFWPTAESEPAERGDTDRGDYEVGTRAFFRGKDSVPPPSADPSGDPSAESAGDMTPDPPVDSVAESATDTRSESPSPRDEIVYHSRHNDRMEIALSFDDGPHPRLTPVILDILAEYGIKATFFMVGENVGYYPAAARAVAEAGHELANHTFSHRRIGRMGREDLRREITACEEAIADLTDRPVRFIRPPEGEMSEDVRWVAGDLDYRVILWDVDTRDWAHTPPDEITRHILNTVQAGDIILMHDFIGYNSPTPEALRRVIPALLDRGYRFVTVGELVDCG